MNRHRRATHSHCRTHCRNDAERHCHRHAQICRKRMRIRSSVILWLANSSGRQTSRALRAERRAFEPHTHLEVPHFPMARGDKAPSHPGGFRLAMARAVFPPWLELPSRVLWLGTKVIYPIEYSKVVASFGRISMLGLKRRFCAFFRRLPGEVLR
jgi:hypothetical protein